MSIAERLITVSNNTPGVARAVKEKKGKNLFNMNSSQYSGNVYTSSAVVNGALVVTSKYDYVGGYRSANFLIPDGEDLVGKKVTISGQWEASGENKGSIALIWVNTDNAHMSALRIGGVANGKSATYTIPPKPENAGELALFLYVSTGDDSIVAAGDTVSYRNVQVEVGDAATAYEPYKDPRLYEEALNKALQIKTAMLNLKEELSHV